ncbi:MAG: T9SS type A sorting domain-containing protein [Chitinophagales bacterium]
MKHVFTIALCMLLYYAKAQTWCPAGTSWTYGIGYAFSPKQDYCIWYYSGDTVINGHMCKQIHSNNPPFIEQSNNLITYEDSNKVYWWNAHINKFTVLYDFTKNAGESWTITKDTCAVLVHVDSTSTIIINGNSRKVQYVSGDWYGNIVEGIGNRYQPTPDVWYLCYGIYVDMDYYTGLRCYQDTIIGFHDFQIAPSCDYIVSGIQENAVSTFTISPNPASDFITVSNLPRDAKAYIIFNGLGELTAKGVVSKESEQINLQNLPAGNYYLQIIADKGSGYKPFIVNR